MQRWFVRWRRRNPGRAAAAVLLRIQEGSSAHAPVSEDVQPGSGPTLVHANVSYWALYGTNVRQVLCNARYCFIEIVLNKTILIFYKLIIRR